MFDGALATEEIGRDWNDDARVGDFLRLCRRFDPLLADPSLPLDPDAARELELLARIHDLDDRIKPAALWRSLRLLLAPTAAEA